MQKHQLPMIATIMLLCVSVVQGSSNATHSTLSDSNSSNRLTNASTTAITAEALAETPSPSPSLSGCQVCAASGDCSHAYLDGPGQFCGNWLDKASQRQRCCCPREAICRNTNYECKCSSSLASNRHNGHADDVGDKNPMMAMWMGIVVGSTILLCCGFCYCVYSCCQASDRDNSVDNGAYAKPVYASPPMYGAPNAGYAYTGYGYGGYDQGEYRYARHGDGFDAGTGAVVGGAAGLLGGVLIAEAISDAGDNDRGGYDGGGYDGGGYDGGGEYAGDF